jgi:2-oxo-4-hydroxy-4-carboxy-5-ureidoimidazoline decarboxylase
MGPVERLNAMTNAESDAALLRCCGSRRWANEMTDMRPFESMEELIEEGVALWWFLDRDDQMEALAAHPRIGDLDGLRGKFAATADWCAGEQAGVAGAEEQTLRDLADGNRAYEERFGHTFIVCATGKTAAEMLALLRARLTNDPDTELTVAAEEQAKITQLRLEKL